MVDWKKYRESIGYTQAKVSKDANAWYRLALGYHAAAQILNELSERIPSDTRPFAFNAALSIELIIKAILARKGLEIPSLADGHDLRLLSDKAAIVLSDNQCLTLELLTETIIWSGRYPAPKNESRWSDYQDGIFEMHIVRSTSGNVNTVMANRETFPNWENYLKIWNICVAEFEQA